MATVRWTAEADRWVETIYRHIVDDGFPDRAVEFALELIEKGNSLASMPERCSIYCQREGLFIRALLHKGYRIAYFVEQDTVFIVGVFEGRMVMENYIRISR